MSKREREYWRTMQHDDDARDREQEYREYRRLLALERWAERLYETDRDDEEDFEEPADRDDF